MSVDTKSRLVTRSVEVQAPAAELFEIVADPRRHHELDGSGTVIDAVEGPPRLSGGAKFSMKMKQYGLPYKITSTITDFDEGRVIEWQHPMGHKWRWTFAPLSDASTEVTETFDYSELSAPKAKLLELTKFPTKNARGIDNTLSQLRARNSS